MTSSKWEGSDRTPPAQSHELPPPSEPSIDASLWESVLRQTAEIGLSAAPLTPMERNALHEVVQRYRGQTLTLQPIATALVQAVILPQLPIDAIVAESWQGAIFEIAQSQLDDPSTRDRLERLWAQLQGEWP